MSQTADNKIVMYGTDWCPDCLRAKFVLNRLGVDYVYIDTDRDADSEKKVVEFNQGKRIVPTIFFPDDSALVEPSNQVLTEKIISLGLAKKN